MKRNVPISCTQALRWSPRGKTDTSNTNSLHLPLRITTAQTVSSAHTPFPNWANSHPLQIRLGGLLAGGAGAHPVRPLALGRLHRLPRLPVHRHPHHRRPILLGQDGGQVQASERVPAKYYLDNVITRITQKFIEIQ